MMIQGSKWADRGVLGSCESPGGAPDLSWEIKPASWKKWRGSGAEFSRPCWDSWVKQVEIGQKQRM